MAARASYANETQQQAWHDFEVPPLLHPARSRSEEPLQTVRVLLALMSRLRAGIMDEKEESKGVIWRTPLSSTCSANYLAPCASQGHDERQDLLRGRSFCVARPRARRARAGVAGPGVGAPPAAFVIPIVLVMVRAPLSSRHCDGTVTPNAEVRRVADRCVECFVEDEGGGETLGESQLQQARFEAHNAEWCARMTIGQGVGGYV